MYGEGKGTRCNLILPKQTLEELERLSAAYKVSRGSVVSMAIARMFIDEKGRLSRAPTVGRRRRRHNDTTKDPTEG